jgi:hypothetical protein
MKCISELEAHGRRHASSIVDWLKKNNASFLANEFQRRHERALDYVFDNDEVREKLASLIAVRGSHALYGPAGDKVATVLLQIKDTLRNIDDFRHGRYYDGSLRITNQVSSVLLEVLPYGGVSADVMSVSAAVATAYTYGFFWGQ